MSLWFVITWTYQTELRKSLCSFAHFVEIDFVRSVGRPTKNGKEPACLLAVSGGLGNYCTVRNIEMRNQYSNVIVVVWYIMSSRYCDLSILDLLDVVD